MIEVLDPDSLFLNAGAVKAPRTRKGTEIVTPRVVARVAAVSQPRVRPAEAPHRSMRAHIDTRTIEAVRNSKPLPLDLSETDRLNSGPNHGQNCHLHDRLRHPAPSRTQGADSRECICQKTLALTDLLTPKPADGNRPRAAAQAIARRQSRSKASSKALAGLTKSCTTFD
jgi:hypothetical protein